MGVVCSLLGLVDHPRILSSIQRKTFPKSNFVEFLIFQIPLFLLFGSIFLWKEKEIKIVIRDDQKGHNINKLRPLAAFYEDFCGLHMFCQ